MSYQYLEASELAKIKVGDRVFIQEGWYESRRLKTVTRVTPTLILVEQGKENWERFRKENGIQMGRTMMSYHIASIATPEQIAAYEAKEAEAERVADQRAAHRQNLENKRKELESKFPDSNYVGVHQSQDSRCPEGDSYEVRLLGLTEAQVRKLAELVKGL